MAVDKRKQLTRMLLKKTENGSLEWQESPNDGFFVAFKENSVRISSLERRTGMLFTLSVINNRGEVVETFTDEELDRSEGTEIGAEWYQALRELFELSRRSARGADKVLNEILNELDDGIPF